jgi:cation diffusion facilitator CzcD-associated flavoprotein CzcO
MPLPLEKEVDVVVVGAGFFGLVAAHHFVEAGLNTVILEASDTIGGCWRTQVPPQHPLQ